MCGLIRDLTTFVVGFDVDKDKTLNIIKKNYVRFNFELIASNPDNSLLIFKHMEKDIYEIVRVDNEV